MERSVIVSLRLDNIALYDRKAVFFALSAFLKNPILSICAAFSKFVFTGPGQEAVTDMLDLRNSVDSACENDNTKDFEAKYVAWKGPGKNAATLAMFKMYALSVFLINGMQQWVN